MRVVLQRAAGGVAPGNADTAMTDNCFRIIISMSLSRSTQLRIFRNTFLHKSTEIGKKHMMISVFHFDADFHCM